MIDGDRPVLFTQSIASREGATPRREGADRRRLDLRMRGEGGNQDCRRTILGIPFIVVHFPSITADQPLAIS
jgi:hypothetical protein